MRSSIAALACLALSLVLPLSAPAGQRLAPALLAKAPAYDSGGRVPGAAEFFVSTETAAAYRNVEETFPTRRIPTSEAPSLLKSASATTPFDVQYQFDGATHSLRDFAIRNESTALLVLKGDQILFEQYYRGADSHDLFMSFSSGKSIVSTLVALAVADGHIKSIDDPIRNYLPELTGSAYASATIKQVLQMSSGTSYSEVYDDPASDIARFAGIVARGRGGLYDFARSFKAAHKPGTVFHYATADTEVLGALVARATGRSLSAYMSERLWKPLGAESPGRWLLDQPGRAGRELAGGGLQLRARDYARFGALFANGGRWNGAQIVPSAWIAEATRPQDPHVGFGKVEPGTQLGYGFQWWCLPGAEHRFTAWGIHGQFVFVDPTSQVVVVALSSWQQADDIAKEREILVFFAAVADALR